MLSGKYWRLLMMVCALVIGSEAWAKKPCYVPRERRCEPTETTYYYRPTPRITYYEPETTYYRRTSYTYESEITIRTRISYTSESYYSSRW